MPKHRHIKLQYLRNYTPDEFQNQGNTINYTSYVVYCKWGCTVSVGIGRVSYLIYVSMRHYVLTTSGDIVVCFHTALCLSC